MSHKEKKVLLEKIIKMHKELPLYQDKKISIPLPRRYVADYPTISPVVVIPEVSKSVVKRKKAAVNPILNGDFKTNQPHGNNF